MTLGSMFSSLARGAANLTGHPLAFLCALSILLIWGVTGPMFEFSDTWQLVINTGTSVVTFLMVFLIQSSQNRDTIAIHLKLDELIRSIKEAQNSAINLENLEESELKGLLDQYRELANSGGRLPGQSEMDPAAPAAPERTPPSGPPVV